MTAVDHVILDSPPGPPLPWQPRGFAFTRNPGCKTTKDDPPSRASCSASSRDRRGTAPRRSAIARSWPTASCSTAPAWTSRRPSPTWQPSTGCERWHTLPKVDQATPGARSRRRAVAAASGREEVLPPQEDAETPMAGPAPDHDRLPPAPGRRADRRPEQHPVDGPLLQLRRSATVPELGRQAAQAGLPYGDQAPQVAPRARLPGRGLVRRRRSPALAGRETEDSQATPRSGGSSSPPSGSAAGTTTATARASPASPSRTRISEGRSRTSCEAMAQAGYTSVQDSGLLGAGGAGGVPRRRAARC